MGRGTAPPTSPPIPDQIGISQFGGAISEAKAPATIPQPKLVPLSSFLKPEQPVPQVPQADTVHDPFYGSIPSGNRGVDYGDMPDAYGPGIF